MTTEEIIASIDQRIADAQTERQQLEAAKASLLGTRRTDGRTSPRPVRRRQNTGSTVKLDADSLLKLVPASGISRGILVTQTRASENRVLSLLKGMEAEGRVRREGERKLTRWHAVTDDDRVKARATELRTQQRRTRKAKKAEPAAA